MASIFDKLSTLVKSNIHSLLDAAIDLNSVAACKQHVRDLEDAANEIKRAAAGARADVGQAQAAYDGTKHTVDENTANAELLLGDDDESNDNVALQLMTDNETLAVTLAEQLESLEAAKKIADAMGEASNKLTAKKTEMIRNINRLEALERSAKSKSKAADALQQVAALSNGASAVSVDDVAARIKRESAVQDERLNEALKDATAGGSTADAIAKAKAAKKIEEMKAALAAKKAGGATA